MNMADTIAGTVLVQKSVRLTMRMRKEVKDMVDKEWLVGNPHLSAEAISPIEERVTNEELREGLERLRERLGQEKYDRYIAPLHGIAKNADSMLIRAANMRERTLLERECLSAIRSVFHVRVVRIIG